MLVFQMVFKVGIGRFLFCISKSGVLCVLLFRLHGQTTHFPVCLHHIFFLSLLNHAVEISGNITHIKSSNGTCSVIKQNHSKLLLLTQDFRIAMSLLECILRDTFVFVRT